MTPEGCQQFGKSNLQTTAPEVELRQDVRPSGTLRISLFSTTTSPRWIGGKHCLGAKKRVEICIFLHLARDKIVYLRKNEKEKKNNELQNDVGRFSEPWPC